MKTVLLTELFVWFIFVKCGSALKGSLLYLNIRDLKQ